MKSDNPISPNRTIASPPRALLPISVTVPNALNITGLGRTKFYELIAEGRIKTLKIGTRTLVVYESLRALIEGGAP